MHRGDPRRVADGRRQALLLAGLIRERGITHLHAHFGTMAAGVARLAAGSPGSPTRSTLHAKDIFHEDVDDAELSARIPDAAAVVTVSDFNEQYLRHRYGDATGTLVRIYNGIDLDAFAPSRPDDRPPVVVGVGRLVEKKGFHHLVDAVGLLRDRGRPIRLDLIGGGPEEQALRARVAALGPGGPGHVPRPLTQSRDPGPGARGGGARRPVRGGARRQPGRLPTVILESLALGTPVVSTPVTGIPEAILHGRTGLLVPEGDAVALAEALDRLVADAGLRCGLAEQGRRHVEERFDTRKNTGLLHAVIGSRAAVPHGWLADAGRLREHR